jgi:hypothetical protein
MTFNYKTVALLILLAITITIAVDAAIPRVSAADDPYVLTTYNESAFVDMNITALTPEPTQTSSITVDANVTEPIIEAITPEPTLVDNNTYERIAQGQCVEIGKKYDISGMNWWSGYIGWYGRYVDDFSPTNLSLKKVLEIPYSVSDLRRFSISAETFSQYPGYWYVLDANGIYERAANNRLFYVSDVCLPKTNRTQTPVNVTPKKVNDTELVKSSKLPGQFGDGIVLARGDELVLHGQGNASEWLFGRELAILDRPVENGTLTISSGDLINAENGIYRLAIQSPGDNNIFEAHYNPAYKPDKYFNYSYPAIVSPFVKGNVVNINGIQPMRINDALKEYIAGTIDDKLTEYNIDFSDADIQVARLDATTLNDNRTFMLVRGYTNMHIGTELTVTLDAYQTNSISRTNDIFHTLVEKGNETYAKDNLAEWKQFSIVIPIDYGNEYPGQHFLTVSADNGAIVTVPFYVRKELPAHYIPPTYIEYVDNSPFIPPVIVTKEVIKEVTKEVIVSHVIIEKPNYVELAKEVVRQFAPIVIGGIIALILAIYMVSVVVRTYERRKQNKGKE